MGVNIPSTLVVSLDFSAAFDTIEHSVLIQWLSYSLGVVGTALSWIKCYLTDRKQSVHIGQYSSLVGCTMLCRSTSGLSSAHSSLLFILHLLLLLLSHTACSSSSMLTTHTQPFYGPLQFCPGLLGWAGTRKVKPGLDLLEQAIVSGNSIMWATCKSAPWPRHNHTSIPPLGFYRPDALLAAQPTASKQ